MNSTLSLIAVAGALACGLTFARPVQVDDDPEVRLAALEKEFAALKAEVVALRKAPAATTVASDPSAALRQDLEKIVQWVQAQNKAAEALANALEDARSKGFTAGINPDSRTALLTGFGELSAALKTPLKLTPPEPKPAAPAKPAQGRAAQR
jgi:hypothetical protein